MKRVLSLKEIWSWLPAFRVVAETQHLPTAARHLQVSPPALSRTIKLLEASIGKPLFNREGRGIRLNHDGEQLLVSVRDSMRLFDSGLSRIASGSLAGPIHISVAGPFNWIISSVLEDLRDEYPSLMPYVHTYSPSTSNERLLCGELDLVITAAPRPHAQLAVGTMGTLSSGVYCGRQHPLFRTPRPTLARIVQHEFVAPMAEESSPQGEGWPPHVKRRVTIYVQHLEVALRLCEGGRFLGVFPDLIATGRRLRRLPVDVVPPINLYSLMRRRLDQQSGDDIGIDAVCRHWMRAVDLAAGKPAARPRRK